MYRKICKLFNCGGTGIKLSSDMGTGHNFISSGGVDNLTPHPAINIDIHIRILRSSTFEPSDMVYL
jgi:hypothetical protein